MPRTCTICAHPEREPIDKALVDGERFRNIAERYQVNLAPLVRHRDDHIPATLVKAREAVEAAHADDLLAQVTDLRDRALGILGKAETADDLRAALAAIREARGCLELLGKLAGELRDSPTINIVMMAEWRTVQAAILMALEPYADARLAVASALTTIKANHAAGHA